MSAPANGQKTANGAQIYPNQPSERQKMSSSEILSNNGRFSGDCADLP